MNRFKISTRVALMAGALSLLVLVMGLMGLWGTAQANAALRVLYEERLTATQQMGQIQGLLLRNRLALAVALVTPLWKAGVEAAHVGIATATACAGILNALLLWRSLRRRGLYQAEPGWWRWLARIALGLLAMAAAVLAVRGWVGEWTALTVPWRWIWLLAAVAAGAGAYGLVMLATGLRLRHLRGP